MKSEQCFYQQLIDRQQQVLRRFASPRATSRTSDGETPEQDTMTVEIQAGDWMDACLLSGNMASESLTHFPPTAVPSGAYLEHARQLETLTDNAVTSPLYWEVVLVPDDDYAPERTLAQVSDPEEAERLAVKARQTLVRDPQQPLTAGALSATDFQTPGTVDVRPFHPVLFVDSDLDEAVQADIRAANQPAA